jgi:HD-GYP domain-containing protein (c-di-GMP phosphodiesterase class II)
MRTENEKALIVQIERLTSQNMILKSFVNLRIGLMIETNKQNIYDSVLNDLQKFFGAKWCVLRIIDLETNELVMVGGNTLIKKIANRVMPKGTFLEKAMISGKVVIIEDIATINSDERLPYYCADMRAVAMAPIVVGTNVKGTLKVYCPSPRHWQESELNFLETIAEITGILLDAVDYREALDQTKWELIYSLVKALEMKDKYTSGHSHRVASTAEMCGETLGLSEELLAHLSQAAFVHDIGKIGINDVTLNKAGKLSELEWAEIKEHSTNGFTILKSGNRAEPVVLGVLHHHEDYNGGGYPAGLAGEEIPLISRVIRIADTYDAMTSDRSYRKGMSRSCAISELQKGVGRQFDPNVLDVFMRIL